MDGDFARYYNAPPNLIDTVIEVVAEFLQLCGPVFLLPLRIGLPRLGMMNGQYSLQAFCLRCLSNTIEELLLHSIWCLTFHYIITGKFGYIFPAVVFHFWRLFKVAVFGKGLLLPGYCLVNTQLITYQGSFIISIEYIWPSIKRRLLMHSHVVNVSLLFQLVEAQWTCSIPLCRMLHQCCHTANM